MECDRSRAARHRARSWRRRSGKATGGREWLVNAIRPMILGLLFALPVSVGSLSSMSLAALPGRDLSCVGLDPPSDGAVTTRFEPGSGLRGPLGDRLLRRLGRIRRGGCRRPRRLRGLRSRQSGGHRRSRRRSCSPVTRIWAAPWSPGVGGSTGATWWGYSYQDRCTTICTSPCVSKGCTSIPNPWSGAIPGARRQVSGWFRSIPEDASIPLERSTGAGSPGGHGSLWGCGSA